MIKCHNYPFRFFVPVSLLCENVATTILKPCCDCILKCNSVSFTTLKLAYTDLRWAPFHIPIHINPSKKKTTYTVYVVQIFFHLESFTVPVNSSRAFVTFHSLNCSATQILDFANQYSNMCALEMFRIEFKPSKVLYTSSSVLASDHWAHHSLTRSVTRRKKIEILWQRQPAETCKRCLRSQSESTENHWELQVYFLSFSPI